MSMPIARSIPQIRFALLAGIAALGLVLTTPREASAMKIQQVTSPGGITAWLVEEHSVPLIAMQFAFKGGAAQDPADKAGTAHFLTAMLDEGAGEMRSAAFQQRIEELAVRMSFSAGQDNFSGSFQTLTENRDPAIEMLRLALNEPRFDADAIERMRRQIGAGLKFDAKDPDKIASRAWFKIAFGDHPYGRPVKGLAETIARIGRDDLEAYRKRNFARDNLKVAVVGDIDAAGLSKLLDRVFGALPAKAQLAKVANIEPKPGPVQKIIEMNVPQSVAQFGHSGIERKDKEFIPAYILNYILGGGGFSSRLTEEVREKRGLAYSVYSYIYPYSHSSVYLGGVATKNEAIAESLKVIRAELERMAKDGPTADELKNAKQYLTGSYALRFDTSSKIASQLLWIQIEDLGIDYIDRRNDLVEAVSIEDVRHIARRLLQPGKLIVTIVGKPTKLKNGS